MTAALSFAALLPRLLLGFCLIRLIWRAEEPKRLALHIFLAAGVGFGASSLLSFYWIWLGFPIAVYAVLESAAALLLAAWCFRTRRISLRGALSFRPALQRANIFWSVFLMTAGLVFIINLTLVSLRYPHGRMDAWTNWNVVARFIYRGGDAWQNTFLRQLDHPDYPLFMATSHAVTWALAQKASTWGPIAFHFAFSISAAGLLFALVHALRDDKQAALAALVFMSQPSTAAIGMSQYADFPLAYMILAAVGLALLYHKTGETAPAVIAGFLAGVAAWTKNEGMVAAIGCTLVWASSALLQSDRAALWKYALGLAPPVTTVALFKAFLAPANDLAAGSRGIFERIMDAERYVIILNDAAVKLWEVGGGPVSVVALAALYALIVGKTRLRLSGLWIPAVVISIQLLAYFFIYLVTPHDLQWHLKTSFNRLYYHIFPLALFWLFLWLKSPQELPQKER